MATGHALQRLVTNGNRVFHDVECAAGTIDHVVVGLQGIYTVSVIAVSRWPNCLLTYVAGALFWSSNDAKVWRI